MSLHIYNTQTRSKETFVPQDPNRVTMYVCGPTVYNFVHIGNARPVVIFDVLSRWLKTQFPEVVYARNITDIDDKINKAAQENNESIKDLSQRFTAAFHEDMDNLNVKRPGIEPFATDHIPQIIEIINQLIEKDFAYEAEGHVLFHVPAMADYGKLSGRNTEDLLAGARVEVAPYKKDAGDFVLWKPSTEDLPGWESPWGRGRPGWHIECTAMIGAHLGNTIDIHGGGQDLIFPHHENELAQGSCAHGEDYVKYWMHNGYITLDNKKMSKSEGNFFTVRDLLENYQGEVLRYALLNAHYRSPLDWSEETLKQAKASLDRIYTALQQVESIPAEIDQSKLPEAFSAALDDDLNTPIALAELHQLTLQLNKSDSDEEKAMLKGQLLSSAAILGLLEDSPEAWLKWQSSAAASSSGLSDADIEDLIQQRKQARIDKDFAKADAVRDQLKAAGIVLKDSADGTTWVREV